MGIGPIDAMKLLLTEDDEMIGSGLRKGLRQESMAVDWVRDGRSSIRALVDGDYDLWLLDLGLPDCDGLDLLRQSRERSVATPALILTARDSVIDRVKGLNSGADDYLPKPFDLSELVAELRALHRRSMGISDASLRYGELVLIPATHGAIWAGQPLFLSHREFAILEALLERPGVVLSRHRLEEKLYGWGEEVQSNAIEVHIHSLRRKLGVGFIRNVRGVGYVLQAQT